MDYWWCAPGTSKCGHMSLQKCERGVWLQISTDKGIAGKQGFFQGMLCYFTVDRGKCNWIRFDFQDDVKRRIALFVLSLCNLGAAEVAVLLPNVLRFCSRDL